jgi:hypothetical protein
MTVDKPGTIPKQHNWQPVMGDIKFDLLYDPNRNESRQAVHEGTESNASQTGAIPTMFCSAIPALMY